MSYPKMPEFAALCEQIANYSQLKHEYGAKGISPVLREAERSLKRAIAELKKLPENKNLAVKEPNGLDAIRKLRPSGVRRMWEKFSRKEYLAKLEGAFLGRLAGCTLGAPVEFWPVQKMRELAEYTGQEFPPRDYWLDTPDPYGLRYKAGARWSYVRGKMDGVPVDDDIMYTMIGLLIAEEYGLDFTVEDVGRAWEKYLPIACTAEEVALRNLKAGVPALKAGAKDNPYCELIGAFIRADPWGYIAAGWPEKAAELAYRDAFLSHRRNGVYGEMFFAAAIAAAFAVSDPMEAFDIALSEIPAECSFAKEMRWAIKVSPQIKNYLDAREAVNERYTQVVPQLWGYMYQEKYSGMHHAHAINNACLVVWGVGIGGTDVNRVISETVAMGMDNDCTAATAGSIAGAVAGREGLDDCWVEPFNNTIHSYLIGKKKFKISSVFEQVCKAVFDAL